MKLHLRWTMDFIFVEEKRKKNLLRLIKISQWTSDFFVGRPRSTLISIIRNPGVVAANDKVVSLESRNHSSSNGYIRRQQNTNHQQKQPPVYVLNDLYLFDIISINALALDY